MIVIPIVLMASILLMMFAVSPDITDEDAYSMYNMSTGETSSQTDDIQERIKTLESSMDGITTIDTSITTSDKPVVDASNADVQSSVNDIWVIIQKWASTRNQDPLFIASVVAQESTFVPTVRNSQSGATGLMQVTAIALKEAKERNMVSQSYTMDDLYKPDIAVEVGTACFKIFADYYDCRNYDEMAVAYNAGQSYLPAYRASGDAALPGETSKYHIQLMKRYEAYQTGAMKVGER